MASQSKPQLRVSIANFLANVVWVSFKLGFGLLSLASTWTTAVLKNGALWAKDTEAEKRELSEAQSMYWALDRDPIPAFRHAFFRTKARTCIHYITNGAEGAPINKNVAIFIHGFPDSYLLWRHVLQSVELQRSHILIAVDLPGYGGSDSLPGYGPNDVLETLSEFILEMRGFYLNLDRKLVVVTHDWGALVGARLASEASDLADHWIITSGIIPRLTHMNAVTQFTLAKQMFHTWTRTPSNPRLLKAAFVALRPVRSQFRRSFYIFCFHLPRPLSNLFATFGNFWFLRILHGLSKGKPGEDEDILSRLNTKEVGEAMAMSTGPGITQLGYSGELKYGESVRRRVRDRGMSEKVRLYQEGLFADRWEKSLETTVALFEIANSRGGARHSSSSSTTLLGEIPDGSLKAPATIILGEHDPAFDQRLALDNIKDFLVGGSQVIIVKDGGHWLPLESSGRRVLEKTILWALSQDTADRKETPFATMSNVKVVAET
ncbi:Alpha/Beta hydrolase protein [Phaeosphaeriaceae sp. PMI808]|nr:Alpha/Beta hydrolase protein [Phaeosphaeriaceae sp. PMI808]